MCFLLLQERIRDQGCHAFFSQPAASVSSRQEAVTGLLKNMFEGERSEASIVNGTQVLLTLLETRRSG